MQAYKEEFIRFMVRSGVLTFGDFTAKSGRKTPYFVNTGNYKTGEQIAKLGEFYASCLGIAEVLQYMRQTKCCRIYAERNHIVIQAILHSICGKQSAAEYMLDSKNPHVHQYTAVFSSSQALKSLLLNHLR